MCEGIQYAVQNVPVSNPGPREVGREDGAMTSGTESEGPILQPDADGVEERPAEDGSDDPSPGRQVHEDTSGFQRARGEIDRGRRRR